MSFFTDWWAGLNLLQQSFAVVAIPATVVLFLQTLLLLFGLGSSHDVDHGVDHDFDHDLSHDFDHDSDAVAGHDAAHEFHDTPHDGAHHAAGLRIFTVRGIVAF